MKTSQRVCKISSDIRNGGPLLTKDENNFNANETKDKLTAKDETHIRDSTHEVSSQTLDYISIEDGEGEDSETMLITGHFNPKRVKIDIDKVHPSILNSGNRNSNMNYDTIDEQGFISRFQTQLSRQELMIKDLVSKLNKAV